MFLDYKNIIMQRPELTRISASDIQEIFEKTLREFKEVKTRLIYLDASYLYTFDLNDFDIIKKFNILGRYDINAVLSWHTCLEKWYNDHPVILGDKTIQPIKISRTFDRVTNEGMEMVADALIGAGSVVGFPFRDIGDGDIDFASTSDTKLVNRVDVINVNEDPEGGSLSNDGSTIYSIGNHSKTVPTPANGQFTECGMESDDNQSLDKMLDHSVFEDPVPHTQNADAPGSTTVVYMCSA